MVYHQQPLLGLNKVLTYNIIPKVKNQNLIKETHLVIGMIDQELSRTTPMQGFGARW